jgi:hypothetical protein
MAALAFGLIEGHDRGWSSPPILTAGMASAMVYALRHAGQVFGVAVLGAFVYARPQFVPGLHGALLLSGTALLAAAGLAYRLTPPGSLVGSR